MIFAEYTREEVSKHDSVEKRIWVTYKNGVYDITDFVPNHPGSTQILMAAGGSMEPFWKLYAFHVVGVLDLLKHDFWDKNLWFDSD